MHPPDLLTAIIGVLLGMGVMGLILLIVSEYTPLLELLALLYLITTQPI